MAKNRSVTPHLYNTSLALLTDQYQMTMAYGYWKEGLDQKESVFHLFFRKAPFNGGFTISAGLEAVVDYLERFQFDQSDFDYLSTLKGADGEPLFDPQFFQYLAQQKFTCHIDAVPEGTVVFPYEPILRVQGPLIQCQLLETPLLNLMNFPSLIATKAARLRVAAKDDIVLEFGLRRAQGIDGALTASRAAYIGGCDATSNILAGKLFGIPVSGTHSHSWVMVFDDELESFESYARALPNNCVFLVDTYNSLQGVKKAIKVGLRLKEQGKPLLGVRLDSGDLTYLSIETRKLLDEAGFYDTAIVASNELDESLVSEMKRQGAKIVVWGVGTNLITGGTQAALDGVYKISAIRDIGEEWKYKIKLSEQMTKISNPGILQVRRFYDENENIADAIYDVNTPWGEECHLVDPLDPTRSKVIEKHVPFRDLLVPIFREGKCVYPLPTLDQIRERREEELKMFHGGIKRFVNPHQYIVGMEKNLHQIKLDLVNIIRKNQGHTYIVPRGAS